MVPSIFNIPPAFSLNQLLHVVKRLMTKVLVRETGHLGMFYQHIENCLPCHHDIQNYRTAIHQPNDLEPKPH